MRNLFLLLTLLLTYATVEAQNSLKGSLYDQISSSPLPYATVALYSLPDSTMKTGVVTTTDGSFKFERLSKGKYYYVAKFMGYKDAVSQPIAMDGKPGIHDAGKVLLNEESKTLHQIDVVGQKIKGVEMVDKTVYNITADAANAAGSGTDLMRRIPSIQVDMSNNLTLQGSSNILILIDGKERDKSFIAQLDPKSIDKIEVMTNPSSKYDSGVTGVINVVLKKDRRGGFSTLADLEIPTFTPGYITSPYVAFDYGTSKLHLFVSSNAHFEGFDTRKYSMRDTGTDQMISNGKGDFCYHGGTIHYGFDYFINDKNVLNFYANYNPSYFKMNFDMETTQDHSQSASNYLTSKNRSQEYRYGQYYSVFYKHNFSKSGHQLTLESNYYNSIANLTYTNDNQATNSDFSIPSGSTIKGGEFDTPGRETVNTKIDYTLPLSDKLSFEAGYQNYLQFIGERKDYVTGPVALFNYEEQRNAGYLRFSSKIKKFNLQAGLRGEGSMIKVENTDKNTYFYLLPNASVQYAPGKQQTFKLAFKSSIDRPQSGDLNPSIQTIDAFNRAVGNPNLKPKRMDLIQFTYSKNFRSNFIAPEIYFEHSKDAFNNVVEVNNAISTRYVDNIGQSNEVGMAVNGSFQIGKRITLNPFFKGFFLHTNALNRDNIQYEATDDFAWMASIYAAMKLPANLTLWSYASYNSPVKSLQKTFYRDPIYLLGLEKGLWKDKGKIGINWYIPLKKEFRFTRNVYESPQMYQDDDNYIKVGTLVSLKFTYRFSKGKEVKKVEREKSLERDGKGGLG